MRISPAVCLLCGARILADLGGSHLVFLVFSACLGLWPVGNRFGDDCPGGRCVFDSVFQEYRSDFSFQTGMVTNRQGGKQ